MPAGQTDPKLQKIGRRFLPPSPLATGPDSCLIRKLCPLCMLGLAGVHIPARLRVWTQGEYLFSDATYHLLGVPTVSTLPAQLSTV